MATAAAVGRLPEFIPPCDPQTPIQDMNAVLARCMPLLYRKAFQYLRNTADAEDAVQEALLSAHKHLDQFRGQARLSTWLTAIVINSARMQLRRRPRHSHISLDEKWEEQDSYWLSERLSDDGPTPEDECRQSEFTQQVKELAANLSAPLRRAFQLRDLDGLTTRETAKILGVTDGTVKAQLARARAKMRQFMRKRAKGQPIPTRGRRVLTKRGKHNNPSKTVQLTTPQFAESCTRSFSVAA